MSTNKRQKSSHTSSSSSAAAAASSSSSIASLGSSGRAAAPAPSSSSHIFGSRRSSSRVAQPASSSSSSSLSPSQADPEPIPAESDPLADEDWVYPEPAAYIATLSDAYKLRLEPSTAPVFGKYKQSGIDGIVGEVMKFILQRTSTGLLVSHKDVLHVLADRCTSGATYIIADARRRFMELYGYELVEVNKVETIHDQTKKRKTTASSAPTSSSVKSYTLRIPAFRSPNLRRAFNSSLHSHPDTSDALARRGLLFWLYAFIHAEESSQSSSEGGVGDHVVGVREDKLWRQMKETLKLDKDMVRERKQNQEEKWRLFQSMLKCRSLIFFLSSSFRNIIPSLGMFRI